MTDPGILNWLLAGDISIQYQAYRDLFGIDEAGTAAIALIFQNNRDNDS